MLIKGDVLMGVVRRDRVSCQVLESGIKVFWFDRSMNRVIRRIPK